jgi:hypothetical protein
MRHSFMCIGLVLNGCFRVGSGLCKQRLFQSMVEMSSPALHRMRPRGRQCKRLVAHCPTRHPAVFNLGQSIF